ncbi:MAG TPA: pyridoxamine 5'-phosphate oxidase family protein, partial [Smithella sp.]|nr:pyridoxamine 5'-phosphate oxidase family protein [Smithella sp.]
GRDGREIYMATFKDTKKYHNLIANPNVSLLIDTRVVDAEGTPRALTVTGIVEAVDNDKSIEEIRETLLRKHPDLKDFFNHPDARMIVVRPTTLQLLDNVTDAYFEELRQPKR